MNTKILVALVIGITLFGLTGAASACETTTSDIFYEFVKTVEGQTGPHSVWDYMDVTSSGAFFQQGACEDPKCCNPDSDNAGILNTLIGATVKLTSPNAEYTETLTQKGSATVIKRPRSLDSAELDASTATSQELTITGPQELARAQFDSEAYAGTSYYAPVYGYPGSGKCEALGTIYAKAGLKNPATTSVVAFGNNAQFGTATMGMALSNSLTADPDVDHNMVFMNGGALAYSKFTNAKLDEPESIITTSSAISSCHEFGDTCCGYGSGLDMNVNVDCP